jgi:hypothetical protein
MFVAILAGVLLLMALGAALAGWRTKKMQASDTFAPTDHVEVIKGGYGVGRTVLPTEVHHDDDAPDFQLGD